MELNDVVQWKEEVEPCGSHPGENMTEHQNDDECGVEIQTGTATSCYGNCWSLHKTKQQI